MYHDTLEIEQAFVPQADLIEQVKTTHTAAFDLIQVYLRKDNTSFRPTLAFTFKNNKPVSVTAHFSLADRRSISLERHDPAFVRALYEETHGADKKLFFQNARIRRQEDLDSGEVIYVLGLKGPKKNGVRSEYQFVFDNETEALNLMIHYGAEKMVYKTRLIQRDVMIAGKLRVLELDQFHGPHEGLYKLEIEHRSIADYIKIADWQGFAKKEVTNSDAWRSSTLAEPIPKTLLRLKEILKNTTKHTQAIQKNDAGLNRSL